MVIFRWSFFFINWRHPYRWVAVVFWLNKMILAVDLWDSSAQHQVKRAVDPLLNSPIFLHIHQLCVNSESCVGDLTKAMIDRGRCFERKRIRTVGTPWWWWWWLINLFWTRWILNEPGLRDFNLAVLFFQLSQSGSVEYISVTGILRANDIFRFARTYVLVATHRDKVNLSIAED